MGGVIIVAVGEDDLFDPVTVGGNLHGEDTAVYENAAHEVGVCPESAARDPRHRHVK